MCLIVAFVMLALCIQSFMQQQWIAGTIQLIISVGFFLLLARNIVDVKNYKNGCTTSGCTSSDWIKNIFRKKGK